MQKARRRPIGAPTACRRTVSGSVSLPCSGCFPPFPHGTGPLSVFREYLALRVGPRCFGQDSSCPALLRWPPCHDSSPVRGYHPLRPAFPGRSGSSPCALGSSYYPAPASTGPVWAPASSLAATGAIDYFFLLLRVLRCFSSPRSPTHDECDRPPACRVAPFGHARIDTCLRFPVHFRSLPRPSSPPEA